MGPAVCTYKAVTESAKAVISRYAPLFSLKAVTQTVEGIRPDDIEYAALLVAAEDYYYALESHTAARSRPSVLRLIENVMKARTELLAVPRPPPAVVHDRIFHIRRQVTLMPAGTRCSLLYSRHGDVVVTDPTGVSLGSADSTRGRGRSGAPLRKPYSVPLTRVTRGGVPCAVLTRAMAKKTTEEIRPSQEFFERASKQLPVLETVRLHDSAGAPMAYVTWITWETLDMIMTNAQRGWLDTEAVMSSAGSRVAFLDLLQGWRDIRRIDGRSGSSGQLRAGYFENLGISYTAGGVNAVPGRSGSVCLDKAVHASIREPFMRNKLRSHALARLLTPACAIAGVLKGVSVGQQYLATQPKDSILTHAVAYPAIARNKRVPTFAVTLREAGTNVPTDDSISAIQHHTRLCLGGKSDMHKDTRDNHSVWGNPTLYCCWSKRFPPDTIARVLPSTDFATFAEDTGGRGFTIQTTFPGVLGIVSSQTHLPHGSVWPDAVDKAGFLTAKEDVGGVDCLKIVLYELQQGHSLREHLSGANSRQLKAIIKQISSPVMKTRFAHPTATPNL